MARPTPATPWVANSDGTVDVLVYQGRTFRATVTHPGLTNPSGYEARIGFKAAYDDAALVASGSTEDGAIVLTQLPAAAGTSIAIAVSDEATAGFTMTRGKWDLVLESPGGVEDALVVGEFFVWREVSP